MMDKGKFFGKFGLGLWGSFPGWRFDAKIIKKYEKVLDFPEHKWLQSAKEEFKPRTAFFL